MPTVHASLALLYPPPRVFFGDADITLWLDRVSINGVADTAAALRQIAESNGDNPDIAEIYFIELLITRFL